MVPRDQPGVAENVDEDATPDDAAVAGEENIGFLVQSDLVPADEVARRRANPPSLRKMKGKLLR